MFYYIEIKKLASLRFVSVFTNNVLLHRTPAGVVKRVELLSALNAGHLGYKMLHMSSEKM